VLAVVVAAGLLGQCLMVAGAYHIGYSGYTDLLNVFSGMV